ncbi:hypothetical protein [Marinifilum sp.]|uniref:hypothetical protein n=1 Tax=Marinifilum sp. TaxID=2033137 RepID=UPI003BA9DAB3
MKTYYCIPQIGYGIPPDDYGIPAKAYYCPLLCCPLPLIGYYISMQKYQSFLLAYYSL